MQVERVGDAGGSLAHPDLALGDIAGEVLEVDARWGAHGGAHGALEAEVRDGRAAIGCHLRCWRELVVDEVRGGSARDHEIDVSGYSRVARFVPTGTLGRRSNVGRGGLAGTVPPCLFSSP